MAFTVTEVIDGDTFKVSPTWKWRERNGNVVRPLGYNTLEENESGYTEATKKLADLILNKEVDLSDYTAFTYGRLLCKVTFEGKDLADYFEEHKS
jgi:endonuclease YncB( thermonuclease family)